MWEKKYLETCGRHCEKRDIQDENLEKGMWRMENGISYSQPFE